MKKKGISVIICCYNSSQRLPITLRYIANQKVERPISWEVIIVDNASTDNSAVLAAEEWDKLQRTDVDFIIVDEPQPGLSNAREKGVKTSKYEYILFCDDDNWLFENYISEAFTIFENHPEVMIIGGLGIAKPEIAPPLWFHEYSSWYSTGPQQSESGILTSYNSFVYGAGCVFRRLTLENLSKNNFKSLLSDRKKNSLDSSGDLELCYATKMLGGELFYSNELKFYHFIPEKRLTKEYFIKLNIGIGSSNVFLIPYLNAIQHKRLALPVLKILLNNIKNYLIHIATNRNTSEIDYRKYQLQGTIKSILKNFRKLRNIHKTPFFRTFAK